MHCGWGAEPSHVVLVEIHPALTQFPKPISFTNVYFAASCLSVASEKMSSAPWGDRCPNSFARSSLAEGGTMGVLGVLGVVAVWVLRAGDAYCIPVGEVSLCVVPFV